MKLIDGIKIIQVDGLNCGGVVGDVSIGSVSGGNFVEQVLSVVFSYCIQVLLIDFLFNEIGVLGGLLMVLILFLILIIPVVENVE